MCDQGMRVLPLDRRGAAVAAAMETREDIRAASIVSDLGRRRAASIEAKQVGLS
jgi:hypothetical protein